MKPRTSSGLSNADHWTTTYYTRDASGNVMAIYEDSYEDDGAFSGGQASASFKISGSQKFFGNPLYVSFSVNGVSIMTSVVWQGDAASTAAAAAAAINSAVSNPEYTATASGDVVTVSAPIGSSYNGLTLDANLNPAFLLTMEYVTDFTGGLNPADGKFWENIRLRELPIYGSNRIGLKNNNLLLNKRFFAADINSSSKEFIVRKEFGNISPNPGLASLCGPGARAKGIIQLSGNPTIVPTNDMQFFVNGVSINPVINWVGLPAASTELVNAINNYVSFPDYTAQVDPTDNSRVLIYTLTETDDYNGKVITGTSPVIWSYTVIQNMQGGKDAIPCERIMGKKSYELSDHLGNVMVTVSDKKIGVEGTVIYSNDFNSSGTGSYTAVSGAVLTNPGNGQIQVYCDAINSNQGIVKGINAVAGKNYTITIEMNPQGTSSSIHLYDPTNNFIPTPVIQLQTGSNTYSFTAVSNIIYIKVFHTSNSPGTFFIDNITIKEANNYTADVLSTNDYYPMGGMLMPGRNYNPSESRFKYQGQESVDEISGVGNHYSYKYRESDPRKGGDFWSIDPLSRQYPGWSPYAFSQRRTIDGREFEGLEWQPVNEQGENVAPGAENIANYNWVGYDKFAYQNTNGSISSNPTEGATKIGIGAPEGTVATGYAYGDNWGRKYTSNQYTQSGTISLATLQQDNINTIGGLDASIQTGAKRLLLRSELDFGISLRITEGFRSFATQNEYYSRGRTQAQLNAVGLTNVTAQPNLRRNTRAYGGQSPHNYGLAGNSA